MKVRKYTYTTIKICKQIRFEGYGGPVIYKKNSIIHSSTHKPTFTDEGLVLKHFYGMNQHEIIPWDNITITQDSITEQTFISKIRKIVTGKDLGYV